MAIPPLIIDNLFSTVNETTMAHNYVTSNGTTEIPVAVDTSGFRAVGVTIGIIDIIVGSIGNLLTILAIAGNKKLHKPFHIFIANLCVIDFLTASAMMPFNVTAYYTETWPFGVEDFTCSFQAYSYYCCGYSSIVCLIVITVNRFIGVVYPDDYVQLFTKPRIAVTIIISWIFAPAFLAPIFFFTDGGFGWYPKHTLCVFKIFSFSPEERNYMQFNRVLFQFLPLIIMVVLYSKIFLTSRQSGRAVNELTERSYSATTIDRSRTCSDARRSPMSIHKLRHRFRQNFAQSSFGKLNQFSKRKDSNNSNFQITITRPSVPHNLNMKILCRSSEHLHPNMEWPRLDDAEVLACSESHLQKDKIEKLDEELNSSSSSSLSSLNTRVPLIARYNLDLGKSASVPVSPAMNVRKPTLYRPASVTDSLQSSVKLSNIRDKSFRGSQLSEMMTKSQASPIMSRSRCSSRSSKYTSVIKQEERKRKRVDRRLLRISLTICTVFMILFLPSVIVTLLNVKDNRAHMFASFITWLNSCVNPVIYSFMNSNMRRQYKLLLLKFWNVIMRCLNLKEVSLRRVQNRSVMSTSSFRTSRR